MPVDNELKELREEVAVHPTDLHRRMQLGIALAARHKYLEAIPELQMAMCSPHVHLQAMRLLAEAYDATRMHSLAARIRERLAEESGDEGDSGSAAVPAPTRPIKPLGTSHAEEPPHEDKNG